MGEINKETTLPDEELDLQQEATVTVEIDTLELLQIMDPAIVKQYAIDHLGLIDPSP